MNEWKQAWKLTKIELQSYTIWMVLSNCALFGLLAFFLGAAFPEYVGEQTFLKEQKPELYDLVFLFLFFIVPCWLRPKDSRYQMINSQFYVSPYFVKLMQLPIPESVVIKHRFVTYIAHTVPLHVLFLLLFYLFSGINGYFMPPLTFVTFSIIWIAFSVYAGHVYPANDAGLRRSVSKTVSLMIIAFVAGAVSYLLFLHFSPLGVVMWVVLSASRWPVLSSVISIILAALGMRYWMHRMKKKMNRMDYL